MQQVQEENPLETVILNVGGKKFKTFKQTITSVPEGLLTDFFTQNYIDWITEEGDYFFDRNPDMFVHILDYYRTGILHVPENVSFTALWREVVYFGLDKIISKHQIEMEKNNDQRAVDFPKSWACSMACRISPLLRRALDINLLQFSIMIDINGLYKGIPSVLMKSSADKEFWTDFCSSFAKAPPGSPDDFGKDFLLNFDITRNQKGCSVVSLVIEDRESSAENVSWVLYRLKTCRAKSKHLEFVDRRNDRNSLHRKQEASSVQLEMLTGWQLDFCLPQTLTASKTDAHNSLFFLN